MMGLAVPGMGKWVAAAVEPAAYPVVHPGAVLSFPRDHGAHPDYRTEWWYLTASLVSPQVGIANNVLSIAYTIW